MQINLLPWREHERQLKQIGFGILMAAFLIAALVLIILAHIYFQSLIASQNKSNAYLQTELQVAQNELSDLKQNKVDQMKLIQHLHFLINLRRKSYAAVLLVDTLAKTTPVTILLDKVERVGDNVAIYGTAESDPEVTVFMKNIGAVKGFKQPELAGITSVQGPNGDERHFQIKVVME
jgi:type IV pilus assembly protein PilN